MGPWLLTAPGGDFNIKISSYQNENAHYKDKMVSQPSYLCNENLYTLKDIFILNTGPGHYQWL